MNRTRWVSRRLILGLSIEDAQSKFDSPESRRLLRVAHERYNEGIYHELHAAQRQRNGLSPERKCHISRFTKPSVPGFQAYVKGSPDDYIVREMWDDNDEEKTVERVGMRDNGKAAHLCHSDDGGVSSSSGTASSLPPALSPKIAQEEELFKTTKKLVLQTLASALRLIIDNVLAELKDRRQSGTLLSKEHQSSVVRRLVSEVAEAGTKSYKSLSSSSHLLEPVEMAVNLFGRKDAAEQRAFKSNAYAVPVVKGDVSYSLWVAGGIIASEELMTDFPFHIAKYVAPDTTPSTIHRLPHVEVEIYFSSELFQLERAVGPHGVHILRSFIGKTMMKQHEPAPTSLSLLLAASGEDQRRLYNIYDPSQGGDAICIPWIRKVRTKVSTVTGVVFSAEDSDENPSPDRMRDCVMCVWRAWGHLVKDLHVYGDLDNLYVAISRQQEWQSNEEYLAELKELEAARDAEESAGPLAAIANSSRTLSPNAMLSYTSDTHGKVQTQFLPISADFTVIECTLERKGLPHNMVMDDIATTLRDMQQEHLEMQRLSVLDAMAAHVEESHQKSSTAGSNLPFHKKVVPVLYEPKIVVSHAGVLENGTHAFQRIRIRGSCRAHVDALVAALQDETGAFFTDRSLPSSTPVASWEKNNTRGGGSDGDREQVRSLLLPKNLSFLPVRASGNQHRLVGHSVSAASSASGGSRRFVSGSHYERNQEITLASDSSALVTEDERQFWKENYYRLSDVKVMFHDRVDPEDALKQSQQPLPPRLHEHLALVNRRLSQGGSEKDAHAVHGQRENMGNASEDGTKKRKRGAKRKPKNSRAGKAKGATADPATPRGLAPEKLFEYLCTDMEAESAQYDLRAGECAGYDYLLTLRRIIDKELPLVTPALTSVASKGFINYYGPQRFATYTRMNMHPGLHLLKGEFKAAAHILVQQFYLDAALEAERRRSGQAFPRMQAIQRYGGDVRLRDFLRWGSRRSVAECGTPMQKVLYNALQASALMGDDGDDDASLHTQRLDVGRPALISRSGGTGAFEKAQNLPHCFAAKELASAGQGLSAYEDDPCAEAFLRVIGPRACAMLVQEFLCFLWNDIVNQRLQRYGTFALLPGDLVRAGGVAAQSRRASHEDPTAAAATAPLTYASRSEIDRGVYTVYDVVLPLPGADIQLPQNHTEDLYVVTLQRYGLPFDPERRQWSCFQPSPMCERGAPGSGKGGRRSGATALSPYYTLTSTFALMEEELGARTPCTEATLQYSDTARGAGSALPDDDSFDAAELRPDLRRGSHCGNPLGLTLNASYRHPLARLDAEAMLWRLRKGVVGDPYQRWGLTTKLQIRAQEVPLLSASSDAESPWIASTTGRVVGFVEGRSVPQLPNVESGGDVEEYEEEGGCAGAGKEQLLNSGTVATATPSQGAIATTPLGSSLDGAGGTEACTTTAVRMAAGYRDQRRWSGMSQLLQRRLCAPTTYAASKAGGRQLCPRRTPTVPSWLPQHDGSALQLRLRLPVGVYPGMLVRELLKMDVNTPDIVDLDRLSSTAKGDRRARSWHDLTAEQQATYQKWIAKRRQQRRFVQQPRAISLALLHQQIFRSSGIRQSLIPTLRSYDSVSK